MPRLRVYPRAGDDLQPPKTAISGVGMAEPEERHLVGPGQQPSFLSDGQALLTNPNISDSRYPFSICLASIPDLGRARKAAAQYQKKGLSLYVVKVELSKGIWYRIYTGYFEKREVGEKLIYEKGFQGAKVIETPWANLIGTFLSPQEELEEKMRFLRELDYFPYVVKGRDGTEKLYMGAFYERDRAQRQCEELSKRGIENQIVKR